MKKYILILFIVGLILIAGCKTKESPSSVPLPEFEEIKNINECLEKQKEEYKPGWEGEPTRTQNKCEIFAEKTDNLTAISILIKSKDMPTVVALAKNPNTPREILTEIYQKKDIVDPKEWQFRVQTPLYSLLSRNPNTSPSILTELSEYRPTEVAGNPSTSIEALMLLSKNKNANVLTALAKNPNTPEDILVYLSQNLEDIGYTFRGEENINIALAGNPNVPKNILVKFLKEKGDTQVVHNFGDNILRVQKEILELEGYYKENFPTEVVENGNYHSLLYKLVRNLETSEDALNEIIERNYDVNYKGKTFSEWAQENINNRK